MEPTATPFDAKSEERLQYLVEKAAESPGLSSVFKTIIDVVNDPAASVMDLKQVVECDPVLTARVLKTINSAYYGLSKPTSDLQYAIALLGFTTIRNLTLTILIGGMFKGGETIDSYSRLGLWKHIMSVALTARLIARRTMGSPHDDEAYLGGLMHDVGIVFLDQYDHGTFLRTMGQAGPDRELRDCEKEIVGFDHAELGAAVASRWRFPERIIECFRWHHDARLASDDARPVASAVELANVLCNHKGINSLAFRYNPRLRSALLTDLRLGPEDMRDIWVEMDREFGSAREFFGV